MSDSKKDMEYRLLDLLYRELDEDEAEVVRRELDVDAELKATFEAWRQVQDVMDELPLEDPDPAVHYKILRVARQQASSAQQPGFFERFFVLLQNPAFAAFGLFIIGGAVFSVFKDNLQEGDGAAIVGQIQPAAKPAAKPASKLRLEDGKKAQAVGALKRSEERLPPQIRLDPAPIAELDSPAAALAAKAEASLELDPPNATPEPLKQRSYKPSSKARPRSKKRVRRSKQAAARRVPQAASKSDPFNGSSKGGLALDKVFDKKTGRRNSGRPKFAPPPAPSAATAQRAGSNRAQVDPRSANSDRLDSVGGAEAVGSLDVKAPSTRGSGNGLEQADAESATLGRSDSGTSLSALAASGTQAVAVGQFRKAIKIWTQYLNDGGKSLSGAQIQYAYFQLATCHQSLGQLSAARRYLNRLSGQNSPYAQQVQGMLETINAKRRASRKSKPTRTKRSKKASKAYDSKR